MPMGRLRLLNRYVLYRRIVPPTPRVGRRDKAAGRTRRQHMATSAHLRIPGSKRGPPPTVIVAAVIALVLRLAFPAPPPAAPELDLAAAFGEHAPIANPDERPASVTRSACGVVSGTRRLR